jgi:hypothetical protein
VTLAIEGWNAEDLQSRALFERSLLSLAKQTYPVAACEVIVLMDAAEADAQSEWVRGLWPGARVVGVPGMTYYRSKNAALREAGGEFLVLADSDVAYEPDWLESLLAAFRPGIDLVAGDTRFEPGFLSRTLTLTDWPGARLTSGYTDWFYGNNLAMRRSLFETIRFREEMGRSGGGSVNVLREELVGRGVRFWYCAEARGQHHLAPFLEKRLRVGAFQVRYRRLAPDRPWAWVAHVPILGPFLAVGGTLVKAWRRAWWFRQSLPGRGLSLPIYLGTIALVKAVEAVGAAAYAWAPGWVRGRFDWFDIPVIQPGRGDDGA